MGCPDPNALLLPNQPYDQVDEEGHAYVGKQEEECKIHDVLPSVPASCLARFYVIRVTNVEDILQRVDHRQSDDVSG